MAKVECRVIKPMWHLGRPIELPADQPAPVISLENSEAVYLQSIGRVQIIDAEAEAQVAAEPAAAETVAAEPVATEPAATETKHRKVK